MVDISKTNNSYVVQLKGMHKFWAFKDAITIQTEQIVRVHHDTSQLSWWTGWRVPGTSLPYVIKAGTYYWGGEKEFLDVCNMENTIIIELKDHNYNRLVVEVEDVAAAISLFIKE